MWQKVSKDENSHYKDICNAQKTSNRPEIIYKSIKSAGCMTPKPKNDCGAEMCRKVGNEKFVTAKWSSAMDLYNRSLCAAQLESSEMISLAYANRSAVFFELKKYGKCLVDIDLAKKAGYPKHLMPKLEARESNCLQLIENGEKIPEFEPKLSFEASKNYPEMANVLAIKFSKEFGRHVIAESDIAVGQTLLMEKAFMTAHRYEKFRRCDNCMKKDVNLIPCTVCTIAMFCSNECSTSIYHQVECNMQIIPQEDFNDNQLHIIRSLLQGIYAFSTTEELQSFVEDAISSDPLEIPDSILDDKSKYRAFLKQWHEPNVFHRRTFDQQVYFMYQTLLENRLIGPKFNSPKKKRFLMHLVAHHYSIINYSGNIRFDNSDDLVGWDFNEFRSVIVSYVNHSCAPNVTLVSFNGYNILVTIRPIKAGEQIFLSYFRNDKINHSTVDRQKYILARCRFNCKCERCKGESSSPSDRKAMKSDECYQFIMANKPKVNFGLEGVMETEVAIALEGKCIKWLNNYGQKAWCTEISQVCDCYRRLLAAKFNNEIRF